jgi:hypothetical protein
MKKNFGLKCQYRRQKRLSLANLDELDVLVGDQSTGSAISSGDDAFQMKGKPLTVARRCGKAMKRGRSERSQNGGGVEWGETG